MIKRMVEAEKEAWIVIGMAVLGFILVVRYSPEPEIRGLEDEIISVNEYMDRCEDLWQAAGFTDEGDITTWCIEALNE